MKQSKQSKPRGSKKCDSVHFEEVVIEPYQVVIHDVEILKMREEEKKEPLIEEEVQLLLEPVPDVTQTEIELQDMSAQDENVYVPRFSEDGAKVFNPSSKRWLKVDSPLAFKLKLVK